MVNTSVLESRGRGFKSRSGQFLRVSLVFIYVFISLVSVYLYMCNKVANAIKQCSIHFESVGL